MTAFDVVMQQVVNGLVLGSFYALVALGYTMIFGVIKLLNFAHGDLYMVGGFVGFLVLSAISGIVGAGWTGVAIAMFFSMIAVGCLGVVIERVAYHPMLRAPRLSILITALAVSLVLQNTVLSLTHGQYTAFRSDFGFGGVNLGNLFITYNQMILVGIAAFLMIGLELFVSRTQYGRAMRAVAIDKDMCQLMGINVSGIIAVTFLIGSALAAAAGTMAGAYYGSIWYFMGFLIGLKAFTAAVIGGIGSIPGAMLGGLILGLLESFGTLLPGVGSAWKDVFSFAILILVLVFKPTGLLGKSEQERM
ncbi:branched-chain amino acid ABC transporter permease [Pelagibacterium sp. 26DY04]|uniref:branched-chain amino acid ABC transporter permease n=1 Tax=unclassified Pelagibacterium TaxID=2623280 RepID=UPI002815B9C4|nr:MULTISPECIES: branched-chain amino acid ABC transporter permease [unclassified Pelagibacterium]WMT87679.1 branched-chain amino acid ABC transporter permease [Pelagibacterium sp. 26DY04]WMT91551.1 branched-chain amino acid ABC transporter permease [Pelagibacterium sp. H642]